MTTSQIIITILIIAVVTYGLRLGPFLLFPGDQLPPRFIRYLGQVLPPASMGLLVVFVFKDSIATNPMQLIPEMLATVLILCLHLWKRNFLLSIVAGTVFYMVLAQQVFI
ncbi:branched-chain amino acid transporter AzlD [Dolosicoccus paucivorans]|uniref:Branched-chain amino acid transporter AzlD n=1 Tax=Dolosicoccus paucivorans TaxID=84521 RepID=A0A2N6SNR7_9LACT|nr:AzlD domain-containing protein [Dolosicoccus paucivorans]PMB84942.1 branched-chain amino acid transporter AzlD [Dolosicoccus paucivorans]PMC58713.1 branched-chain amino acid transporter AzlD [Dolosicoccus paucivorans]